MLESGDAGRGTSRPPRRCCEGSRYQSRTVWAGRRTEGGQAEVSNLMGMQLFSWPAFLTDFPWMMHDACEM